MKRTKEQSASFFAVRQTNERGENRELYKTPIHLIDRIIDSLLTTYPDIKNKIWIDPCAADGAWMDRASAKGINSFISYDLKPLGENVKEQDFFALNSVPKNSFILGNPPYSLVKDFVEKSLSLVDVCYFLGGSMKLTGPISSKCKMLHRFEGAEGNQKDIRSKATFKDTNNKNVIVWTCGSFFGRDVCSPFERQREKVENGFRVGVYSYCCPDKRIFAISDKE